ncbi:nucleotidyltransferase domain-containing protein [Amycolatopsis pigmentata]|uniref:Nucleotidyltransferase domain-containing protein n=1 Tax=Amycolatopsis pigmentata TaxID=450801 RepID=A0ABW5FRE7_9PSEU
MITPERAAEIKDVVHRVTRWVSDRSDVVGLLLVGSCARGAARPDSDIDLVLLTRDTTHYTDSTWTDSTWTGELGIGELIRTRTWGAITEQRFVTASGLEVEIGIGHPRWASVAPVDPGTHRVVSDGARILHDPTGILADLLRACRRHATRSSDEDAIRRTSDGQSELPSRTRGPQ